MPFILIGFHHIPELLRVVMSGRGQHGRATRLLSLAVIVLSLAPLASLYMVLFGSGQHSAVQNFYQSQVVQQQGEVKRDPAAASVGAIQSKPDSAQPQDSVEQPEEPAPAFSDVLRNRNATLEDLWKAFIGRSGRQHPASVSFWFGSTFFVFDPVHHVQIMGADGGGLHLSTTPHWTLAVPWILSFVLGVLLPAGLSIANVLRHNSDHFTSPLARTRYYQEHQRKKILETLNGYSKVLSEPDRVGETSNVEPEGSISSWKLPLPGEKATIEMNGNSTGEIGDTTTASTTRSVVGTCAVCLHAYQTSETVAWSANTDCCHVFHKDCIVRWLVKARARKRHPPCPCCRRPFLISTKSTRTKEKQS